MAAVETEDALVDEKRAIARFYATQLMSDVPALVQQALSTADIVDDLDIGSLARL